MFESPDLSGKAEEFRSSFGWRLWEEQRKCSTHHPVDSVVFDVQLC